MRFFSYVFLIFFSSIYIANANEEKTFIVSIKTRAVFSAYSSTGVSFGTGFVIDAKKGLIVTNKHVARPTDVVTEWIITLHDGSEVKAQLMYSDPWHDFSFLKVPPDALKNVKNPHLNTHTEPYENVVIIGKNENKHFSRQTGTIASLYEVEGYLHQQAIRINLNAQGGASGSPVLNKNGEVIALLFASNGFTSAYALPISYIKDAFAFISKGEKPPRFGLGCLINYQSLDEFVRFNNFPAAEATSYRKTYPNARNRALCVKSVLVNTPAEKKLHVGDIITHVDGHSIGPSLYELESIVNKKAQNNSTIHLTLIRNGKKEDVQINGYDLYKPTIKRIVFFAGATFFEMDDFIKSKTDCTSEKVFLCQALPSSSFIEKMPIYPGTNAMLVSIKSINGQAINNLDELITAAEKAIKKTYFPVIYKNYGLSFGYDREPSFQRADQLAEITYSAYDGPLQIFEFDQNQGQWQIIK